MPRLAAHPGRWLLLPAALLLAIACGGKADSALTGVQPTTPSLPVNLLRNPTLDTAGSGGAPLAWARKFTGSPTPAFTYPVEGRTGSAAAVTLTAKASGDVRWQHESLAITAGTVYTVSFWYKSTTTSGVSIEYTTAGGLQHVRPARLAPVHQRRVEAVHHDVHHADAAHADVGVPLDQQRRLAHHRRCVAGRRQERTAGTRWRRARHDEDAADTTKPPADTTKVPTDTTKTPPDTTKTPPTPPPAPAPAVTITASPAAIITGQSSTITWTSTNATACTASGAWTGTRTLAGNETVTPSAIGTSSYTLTCTGAGGSTLRSTVVTVSAPPPPAFAEGLVTFTLDDAWESQYVNALPILQSAGFKATFFIPSQPLQEGWNLFMTPAMVLDLVAKGHEIGGHTVTHADLSVLSATAAAAEITDSRTYLRALTGQPVASFAYPYGRTSAAIREQLRTAGFTSARGVNFDTQNSPASDKFDLKAICVDTTVPIETLKAQITAAKANKSWYILCVHEVKLNGDELSMTPARFQELVDFVRQTGVKVVTMAEGRALMLP